MKTFSTNTNMYFQYDGTFEGLFTCVFEVFDRKQMPVQIVREETPILFAEKFHIATDAEKANRVLAGLKKKLSKIAVNMLLACWLSELKEVENVLFRYICKAFLYEKSIEMNFADEDVMELSKVYKKVSCESHKIRQFIRFQKTADNVYFAAIEPKYNVLPTTVDFFQDRFADQQWIIYDMKRKYALYYNLEKTEIVHFDDLNIDSTNGKLHPSLMAEEEADFQNSWKMYIKSISIKERINLKLQRQHMPKRFWKYLTEKQ